MDRLRRLLPLPLLAVSTAAALVAPSAGGGWTARDTALVAAAAVWSAVITARLRPDASPRWRLVDVRRAHRAGRVCWSASTPGSACSPTAASCSRTGSARAGGFPAFAVTALIVSGAMAGGYPTGAGDDLLTYLLVAGVLLAVVINSASITYRALEQNLERGRMIRELAEANRRLEESMAENAVLHARLVEQARAAGVVEERRRLAGEIHDTLAQGLTGDRRPAGGGRAGPTPAGGVVPAPDPGPVAGPVQPDRGPPFGPGAAARAAGERDAGRGARGADQRLVAAVRDRGRAGDRRHRDPRAGGHRGGAVPGRPGGTDQRRPAREGVQGAAHADVPGRHAAAGRRRRRGRLRPGRRTPAATA